MTIIWEITISLFRFRSSLKNRSRCNLNQPNWRWLLDPILVSPHHFWYSRMHRKNQGLGPWYSYSPQNFTSGTGQNIQIWLFHWWLFETILGTGVCISLWTCFFFLNLQYFYQAHNLWCITITIRWLSALDNNHPLSQQHCWASVSHYRSHTPHDLPSSFHSWWQTFWYSIASSRWPCGHF